MSNPALSVPGVLDALKALTTAAEQAGEKATGKAATPGRSTGAGLPQSTIDLVHLRASQINGCAVSVDMYSRGAKKAGEPDERLFTLATWRDAPYFSDAERSALALTEAVTRLADRPDPVPDEVFDEAAKHYDEPTLAALIVHIAAINAWNRLNVTTRQPAGDWTAQAAI